MAFSKATNFKRPIKFARPNGDEISFVAEFAPLTVSDANAMRKRGEMTDSDLAHKVLRGVEDADLADVLEDSQAVSAVALAYYEALREGVAAKNSAK